MLEAIRETYGYNFAEYSRQHLERRCKRLLMVTKLAEYRQLTELVTKQLISREQLCTVFSVPVTSWFRNSDSFTAIRQLVFPWLKTQGHCSIWHAACASGEELFSMAIMLEMAGFNGRYELLGTDINPVALQKARRAEFTTQAILTSALSSARQCNIPSLQTFFVSCGNTMRIHDQILAVTSFREHNVACDAVAKPVNMIVCRNLLIYFSRDLQNRVLEMFIDNLLPGGILWLGEKESIHFSTSVSRLESLSDRHRIYRKIS